MTFVEALIVLAASPLAFGAAGAVAAINRDQSIKEYFLVGAGIGLFAGVCFVVKACAA
jgi:hypothetical protein